MNWKEVKGFNREYSYDGNIRMGVDLPCLDTPVIICMHGIGYRPKTEDTYLVCELRLGRSDRLELYPLDYGYCTVDIEDGVQWAYFDLPKTERNTGYAIAYKDSNGDNFNEDIPYISRLDCIDEQDEMIGKLYREGYKDFVTFQYIKPCTFQYDWDYVKQNMV